MRTKIQSVVKLMGLDIDIGVDDILCDDRFLAPGYGLMNAPTSAAIALLARREGVLLDPTYSGKAFAALIDCVENENFTTNDHLVFLHTGGTPSLFGYPELVSD